MLTQPRRTDRLSYLNLTSSPTLAPSALQETPTPSPIQHPLICAVLAFRREGVPELACSGVRGLFSISLRKRALPGQPFPHPRIYVESGWHPGGLVERAQVGAKISVYPAGSDLSGHPGNRPRHLQARVWGFFFLPPGLSTGGGVITKASHVLALHLI